MSTQTQKRKPAYVAYTVTKQNDSDKDRFTQIGVAFDHQKGDGLTILLNALPMGDKIVLCTPKSDDQAQERQ